MANASNGVPQVPPPAADGDYTWANLPTKIPTLEQCEKVIQNWGSSAPRAFAGMPRLSDIGFKDRFAKAYQEICGKLAIIAQDPNEFASHGHLRSVQRVGDRIRRQFGD